ncbi:hypothetical protein SynRS9909_01787 [Synechococcus sp. RS9909]|nr:hypothetical protein SynRS9909_01787 [Synechococcus sp. RS9909]
MLHDVRCGNAADAPSWGPGLPVVTLHHGIGLRSCFRAVRA